MSAIHELIKGIESLKPMPAVFHQIMTITRDPDSSMDDIAGIILYDPSITANLIRLCNSAYFNLPVKIDSVQDAIKMLGLDRVVDLVLLSSGASNFKHRQQGYGLHEGELWKCAVSSALIAKELAEKLGTGSSRIVFTAALLKDIGKVVLDRFVRDTFQEIIFQVRNNRSSFREAEKKIIGIDHAELGGYIAKKWGFSSKMIDIIRHHHLSDESKKDDMEICIVNLADAVCMMMGIGVGSDGLAYRFHEDVFERLKITAKDLQAIIAGFGEKIQKVEDLISTV